MDTAGAAQPRLWTYFASHRDWCDHLLFYEGGAFAQGRLGGSGSWKLAPLPAGNASSGEQGLQLELSWRSSDGNFGGNLRRETLCAVPALGAQNFTAEGVSLECVGGEALPSLVSGLEGSVAPQRNQPRGLLFSSIGSQCLPVVRDFWLADPMVRDFDVALMFYKEPSSDVYKGLQELVGTQQDAELLHSSGMKWPNFVKWMEANGGASALAARYDYIWVVDDDVRLATAEVSRMFAILREHREIEFACPSFDSGSDGVWRYFDGHDPRYKLRYTDFVECTAPVLKTSWLCDPGFAKCLQAVRTGCFIDFCFFPAAGRREDAVAVIDAVQCHHPPRGPGAPSEMRQVKAWEDHKEDDVYFDKAGVPRDWYWFRQPKVFGGIPVDESRPLRSLNTQHSTGQSAIRGATAELKLPVLGFGTAFYPEDHFRGAPEEQLVSQAVEEAIRSGVRLFDCANQYSSQCHVGAALERAMQRGLVRRED